MSASALEPEAADWGEWHTRCHNDSDDVGCIVSRFIETDSPDPISVMLVIITPDEDQIAVGSAGDLLASVATILVDQHEAVLSKDCQGDGCFLSGIAARTLIDRMRIGQDVMVEINRPGLLGKVFHLPLDGFSPAYEAAERELAKLAGERRHPRGRVRRHPELNARSIVNPTPGQQERQLGS